MPNTCYAITMAEFILETNYPSQVNYPTEKSKSSRYNAQVKR